MADTTIEGALDALTSVNKIGFTEFTTGLVTGVFNTIVDASLRQMVAYADLVSSVSKSVSDFTLEALGPNQENVTFAIENDLNLTIPEGNTPTIKLNEAQFQTVTNTFSSTLVDGKAITADGNLTKLEGTPKAASITLAKLKPFVVQKITDEATTKYNFLRTLLQLGMQKVVVDKGHIKTKLTFSIDASQKQSSLSSDKTNRTSENSFASGGGIGTGTGIFAGAGGVLIGGGIGLGISNSSKSLNVNIVNERSSSATNLSADIIGEVMIQFRTDSFPSTSF